MGSKYPNFMVSLNVLVEKFQLSSKPSLMMQLLALIQFCLCCKLHDFIFQHKAFLKKVIDQAMIPVVVWIIHSISVFKSFDF